MRIAWNIGIIVSLLFLPWWLTALVIVGACWMIPRFYEGVFYGILLDSLYGTRFGLHGFAYVFTTFSAVVLIVTHILRNKLIR